MKDRKQQPLRRRGKKTSWRRLVLVLGPTAVALLVLYLLRFKIHKGIVVLEMLAEGIKILRSLGGRKKMKAVESRPFENPWAEPKSSEELFGGSTKIMWGHWHTGVDSMPQLYRDFFLESWKVHNPDWKLIILDQNNFRKYVSMNDIPSTFESLMVQKQSDLFRTAVLLRYGGIFMDVSTMVFKSFDHIWATAPDDKLWIVNFGERKNKLANVNNAFLMVKKIGNAALQLWHRKIKDYLENPNITPDEMRKDPRFGRVKDAWKPFDEPTLPYGAVVWMFADMLLTNEDNVLDHVMLLSQRHWGSWYNSLPYHVDRVSKSIKSGSSLRGADVSNSPYASIVDSPTLLLAFQYVLTLGPLGFSEDVAMSRYLLHNIHTLKFSNEELNLLGIWMNKSGLDDTMGYFFRAATDLSLFPIEQASIDDAYIPK